MTYIARDLLRVIKISDMCSLVMRLPNVQDGLYLLLNSALRNISVHSEKKNAETISNSIGNNIDDILHKFNLRDIVHVICTN